MASNKSYTPLRSPMTPKYKSFIFVLFLFTVRIVGGATVLFKTTIILEFTPIPIKYSFQESDNTKYLSQELMVSNILRLCLDG